MTTSDVTHGSDSEKGLQGDEYGEIEGWAEAYAELVEVEQQVISTIRILLPISSRRSRQEIEEHDLPALRQDLDRHRRRYEYWRRRLKEEEASASALPDSS